MITGSHVTVVIESPEGHTAGSAIAFLTRLMGGRTIVNPAPLGLVCARLQPADSRAEEAVRVPAGERTCLVITGDVRRTMACQRLRFADHSLVPQALRGRAVATGGQVCASDLPATAVGDVLAESEHGPVWRAVRVSNGWHHTSGMALPLVGPDDRFFDHVTEYRFGAWVPVLVFLRSLLGEDAWPTPPLRACFMFDDPNLRWPTYGYADYAKLAADAWRHRYHISFATVPLDGWSTSGRAAHHFLGKNAPLSLLVHGNNHKHRELAAFSEPGASLPMLAQAWRRIHRLERKTGVCVSRVMAAPHGACSEAAMGDMARLGYSGACVSSGSLANTNPGRPWLPRLGFGPAEWIAGLPVLNRFRIARNNQNRILLSALLGQPIIPVGHHQDLAEGVGLLGELADFINGLGQVSWCDMESMVGLGYSTKREGSRLRIRSYSRRWQFRVPEECNSVSVEFPHADGSAEEGLECLIDGKQGSAFETYQGEDIAVLPGAVVNCVRLHPLRISPSQLPDPPKELWPLGRRILAEGRDRILPLLGR